ncbi:AsmA protein, partial [Aquibium sp. A9E412]|uniref:AsmA protein n=1 Tax=Aquibium sp. A9E412 TaxID=2976767 RepID=UPI0025B1A9B7
MAPYFIDWTSYRADFEREASRILGRQVSVNGAARARLLPFPSVTFSDVTVAGDAPDAPAVTVETFSMDAELAPFLRGEVLIFDMRLERPRVVVEIGETGAIDWAVRPETRFDAGQVTLEQVTVSDGRLMLRHAASGRTHALSDIDAVLSAGTLAGPWRIDGQLRVDGVRTALSVSTGRLDADGGMRVRLEAEPAWYPVALSADGEARFEEGRAVYSGDFRIDTLEEPSGTAPAAATFPEIAEDDNRVTGRFRLDHRRLAVEEFRFETGPVDDPYMATGSAFLDLGADPRFSIMADGAQIRLPENGTEAVGEGRPIGERFAAFAGFVRDLPKPAIPGTVELKLPAIVAGDTMVRDIGLSAAPQAEGWRVASLSAVLPGRATLEASGLLTTGDTPEFDGELLLAVGQPSGFAAWLARDVDDAIRRLPSAGFSAEVALGPHRQAFSDLELILGDARFTGRIERRTPREARPSMSLALSGDRLDVEGMAAFASLFVSDAGTNRLADHDLDFDIAAGPVTAAGLTAEAVDTAMRLRAGTLEIDRLTIEGLSGATVSATGTVEGFPVAPRGQIDATVLAVDLAPLVATLAGRFPDSRLIAGLDRRAQAYPGLLDNAEIDLVASVADNGDGSNGAALSAQGAAGGIAFSLAGSGRGLIAPDAEAPLRLELSARSGEAADLYGLIGLPALPIGLAGAAQGELTVAGSRQDGFETRFGLRGEGLEATFEGAARRGPDGWSVAGSSTLESDDVEPWLATAGLALPGFGLGLPAELAAESEYSDGLLVLSALTGSVAGTPVDGDLNGQQKDGRPHVTGSLNLGTLDLWPAVALLYGEAALADPAGGWPQTPFAQSARVPVSAALDLAAGTLRL